MDEMKTEASGEKCEHGCCKGGMCGMHGCCGHHGRWLRILVKLAMIVVIFAIGFACGRHSGNFRHGYGTQRGFGQNIYYMQRGQFPVGGMMYGGTMQAVPFNQATATPVTPPKTK